MKRNASIELLRILLMFGICLCHSVGAGGHICEPVRNIFMMCTVGFIFISGWFGIRLSLWRIAKLLGIALFAWLVVALENYYLHGRIVFDLFDHLLQWWFLRAYLMLMVLSPILNCIVQCITSADAKVRRDAYIAVGLAVLGIYGAAWPMHSGWLPKIRVFLTLGCPCQPGTMCVIYLLARVLKVTGFLEKLNWKICSIGIIISCIFACVSKSFSNYNSPFDFIFAASIFYFSKFKLKESRFSRLVLFAAPSMFFIYLYHSHGTPGFVLLSSFQCWLVDGGLWIPLAWLITAIVIFFIGLVLDMVRRVIIGRAVSMKPPFGGLVETRPTAKELEGK